jgi:hypothetical protein
MEQTRHVEPSAQSPDFEFVFDLDLEHPDVLVHSTSFISC